MKHRAILGIIAIALGVIGLPGIGKAASLTEHVRGRILLQVASKGEAWYVNPNNDSRTYLRDGSTAYSLMRSAGLGITNADLTKIPVGIEDRFQELDSDGDGLSDKLEEGLKTDPTKPDTDGDGFSDNTEVRAGHDPLGSQKLSIDQSLVARLRGKILLQVQSRGEAWYLNPANGKRYYLKDGNAAYQIMRYLSLGISNDDLKQIPLSDSSTSPLSTTPLVAQDVQPDNIPPSQTSDTNANCRTVLSGIVYELSPCSLDVSYVDGDPLPPLIEFRITPSNKNVTYKYSASSQPVGFPDSALSRIWGSELETVGDRDTFVNLNDNLLNANGEKSSSYQGYLPIIITAGDQQEGGVLKFFLNVTVLPTRVRVEQPTAGVTARGCGPIVVNGREFTVLTCNINLTYDLSEGDKPFTIEVAVRFLDGGNHSISDFLEYSINGGGAAVGLPEYAFGGSNPCGFNSYGSESLGPKQTITCNVKINSHTFTKQSFPTTTYTGYFPISIVKYGSSGEPVWLAANASLTIK